MDYTTLARTGLRVSRMGLGCGGHSRLGLARGGSADNAERIVKDALSLGVNFIDTAETYGTEPTVGNALTGVARESYVLSTKAGLSVNDSRSRPGEFAERVNAALRRLRTDDVDVFHLHGVVMVGFNLLNPSSRKSVLPWTMKHQIGTLCMFAVRRALIQAEALRELIAKLVAEGAVTAGVLSADNPLDFLAEADVAASIPEAAYRFCLHEPGMDVILSGTGNPEHLRQNAAFLGGPPLPELTRQRLESIFKDVDGVSGN